MDKHSQNSHPFMQRLPAPLRPQPTPGDDPDRGVTGATACSMVMQRTVGEKPPKGTSGRVRRKREREEDGLTGREQHHTLVGVASTDSNVGSSGQVDRTGSSDPLTASAEVAMQRTEQAPIAPRAAINDEATVDTGAASSQEQQQGALDDAVAQQPAQLAEPHAHAAQLTAGPSTAAAAAPPPPVPGVSGLAGKRGGEENQQGAKRQRVTRARVPSPLRHEDLQYPEREDGPMRGDNADGHYEYEVGDNLTPRCEWIIINKILFMNKINPAAAGMQRWGYAPEELAPLRCGICFAPLCWADPSPLPHGYPPLPTPPRAPPADKIMRKFGEGTFGRVVDAWDRCRRSYVAIKIIRNIPKYRDAAMVELEILFTIAQHDPQGSHRCVRLLEWFNHRGHVCMVFERLGPSLYDCLRTNSYKPFPLHAVSAWR